MRSQDDAFVSRLCKMMNVTPQVLARRVGVRYKFALEPWKDVPKAQMSEIDLDEFFQALGTHVDKQLAIYLAVREELQRKLSQDRRNRLQQRQRIENR